MTFTHCKRMQRLLTAVCLALQTVDAMCGGGGEQAFERRSGLYLHLMVDQLGLRSNSVSTT